MFILTIISIILAFVLPILIISLIIMAFNRRNKDDKVNFSNTIRNIYIYLILTITLLMIVLGTINIFRTGLDLILPEKSENQYYDNDQLEKNETIVETVTVLSILAVSIPIFTYHNKLAKNSQKNSEKIKNNIIDSNTKKSE